MIEFTISFINSCNNLILAAVKRLVYTIPIATISLSVIPLWGENHYKKLSVVFS